MTISKVIEKNKKSIILIDIQIPGENNQKRISVRGTGFIISSDGKFITCAHVYKQIPVNEIDYLGVSTVGKTDEKGITHYDHYKVRLLKLDEENDLALMQIISDENINFESITEFGGFGSVKEGDEVIFMGYPLATELLGMKFGITMNTNSCIISSIKRRGIDGSLHFFMIDTHVNNGSSGSPVFLKESGELIGIISGKISNKVSLPDGLMIDIPANMGICRPSKYITNLINLK